MLIAQWNILDRAPEGWEAKGAVLADALVRRGVDAACLQEVPVDGWTPSRPRSRSAVSRSPPDGSGRGGRTCAPSAGGPEC